MTEPELTPDAFAVMVAAARQQTEPPPPEPAPEVAPADETLGKVSPGSTPADELGDFVHRLFSSTKPSNAALARLVHGDHEDAAPAAPEGPPNFDGGARDTAPAPGNPERDHNEWLVNLIDQTPRTGSADEW